MLDAKETAQLLVLAHAGDEDAKTKLTLENEPLVKSIVRRYRGKGTDYEDLMQLGTMGLIKAILNFDASYGVCFSTYAVPMIAGEIKRFLRDDGSIKVARSVKCLYLDINKFSEVFLKQNDRPPELEEIAAGLQQEKSDILFAIESCRRPVSLFQKVDDGGSRNQTLLDKIAADDNLDAEMTKMVLKKIIQDLDVREKKIVLLRYWRDHTQSEVAQLLNVSQVQVSRLEAKILEKMRKKMK